MRAGSDPGFFICDLSLDRHHRIYSGEPWWCVLKDGLPEQVRQLHAVVVVQYFSDALHPTT
jgi:hypothetical protein